ncbi:sulfatase-like hydrolase/transferase [Paenibacillus filicis]|uniref:Sulfatase-like hydrolase/transferase n=1 Tax=Paenibacillus gyeongsangnamensis TaxID=3388067 RepID=A0ABT4Q8S2_9BACL|nr:sulfatase-like hydrolase/transferase [Paenibacillus filicis]MCZ8513273.1 sulfatase-like hydrolase/transferase [Paenibacillus filicis]
MNRPNILFIMCDQLRHDAIECNGNEFIKTPNLNRIAENGVNFSNMFTPNPICVPARASLTTGCYPHKCTGIKNNGGTIREGFPLLGEELNQRGYETYAVGKLHYEPYAPPGQQRNVHGLKHVELMESGRILSKYDPKGNLQGLEDYHDYLYTVGWGGYSRGNGLGNNDVYAAASVIPQEYYVDTWVVDRSLEYIQNHISQQSDRPFFMWTSFPKPHSAFDPPHPYDQMYDPRDMPEPIGSLDDLIERGLDLKVASHYKNMWDLLSPEAKKVIKAYYYGLITHQDKQVGRLLDFLEEKGLREDTVVIYTSDHGEMLGDFGLYFKQIFYNGSVRVPLLISYPRKLPKGKVCTELAGLQDLLPTILSFTGEVLNQEVDGIDLTSAMLKDEPLRDFYISQCNDHPYQQYMVVNKHWKYIYNQHGGVEELYDQVNDPYELHNLISSEKSFIQELKNTMRDYLIKWCLNNEDTMMMEHNDLVATTREASFNMPNRPMTFGRRYY